MEQQRSSLPPFGGMFWPGMEEEPILSPVPEGQPESPAVTAESEVPEEKHSSEESPYTLPEISEYLDFLQGLQRFEGNPSFPG